MENEQVDERPEDKPAKKDPLRQSKTSGLWGALIALALVLVLLIVFIAQNNASTKIHYFGWVVELPLSVALLTAVAGGILLTAVAGTLRILQLRRRVRRSSRH